MRVSRTWSLLVLIALAGLVGPPAAASASDAGLKALVMEQRAAEKVLEKRYARSVEGLGEFVQSATSARQAARRLARSLDRLARVAQAVQRSYRRYVSRFSAEVPETNVARVGRTLMVRGLQDGIMAVRRQERSAKRFAARFRQARTYDGIGRISRRLDRYADGEDARAERSEKRLKRGRELIRAASASAPAPAPAPGG
jgi:hypothetical protein